MARRKNRPQIITMPCRRGCGTVLSTLSAPIHSTQADWQRYHGICDDCLTPEEKADMAGPMLHRTASHIIGRT